jgi:predicted enzyme related to lactoylglutathione lyase
MLLHSVTVLQAPEKNELAPYFYQSILGLPEPQQAGPGISRFYPVPTHFASQPGPPVEPGDEDTPWGGFTGIQFNVFPADDLNPIVARLRATGVKQPPPREVDGKRLMWAHDPSGNVVMLVGMDERPDEPLIEDGVGSVSVFVSDIARARAFYVDALRVAVRAEPAEGLLVLGAESGTAITIYQVPPDQPSMPIGRHTGLTFATPDVDSLCADAIIGEGRVVHELGGTPMRAATLADPDGNIFTVLRSDAIAPPREGDDASSPTE